MRSPFACGSGFALGIGVAASVFANSTVEDLVEEDGGFILVGAVQGMSADERILAKGKVDLDKLQPLVFDSAAAAYRVLGPVVAPAFKAGKAIK